MIDRVCVYLLTVLSHVQDLCAAWRRRIRLADAGVVTPEVALLAAILAGGAIAVGTVIVLKATGTANNISTK
ncbi:MAG TPA: hypothetical protein VFQ85_12795 [Mycobacteriales bacterium]|jgi:hypothetical protein|nr:hypothetical protein [Mycobacteriales bacterium]